MKLNNECIRDVLLICEKEIVMSDEGVLRSIDSHQLKTFLNQYDIGELKYTVNKLKEAKLIEVDIQRAWGVDVLDFKINDITYIGYEFLENIRDKSNWNKVKEVALKCKSVSIQMLIDIAKEIVISEFDQIFG